MTLARGMDPPAPIQLTGLSVLDVMTEPALFGTQFSGESWSAWRTVTKAIAGLPLDKAELALYRRCTNRRKAQTKPAREAWLVAGRRAGKSATAALWAVYAAAFRSYQLAVGERGTVMVIAADRRQARVVFGYIRALFRSVPMLESLVERETSETIILRNGINIEIHTASFRTLRGYTVVAAICDEVAFWRAEDAANPDKEILAALRPALATTGGLLLVITSPYARLGEVWRTFDQHFGRTHDPILVWRADSATMNPTIDPAIIAQACEDDPVAAAAEWGGLFRSDIEGFVPLEVVDACTIARRYELAPAPEVHYVAFVDPSGGSSDSMTLAIAHREKDVMVLDLLREVRPPFSPEGVTRQFAEDLHRYHVSSVTGDRYGGEYPREIFRVHHGIEYRIADRPKSELYLALLPLLNSKRIELLDLPRLRAQLVGLERRTVRGGKDSIDHAAGGAHDDLANAAAGALILASPRRRGLAFWDSDRQSWSDEHRDEDVTAFQARIETQEEALKRESNDAITAQVKRTGVWFPGDTW